MSGAPPRPDDGLPLFEGSAPSGEAHWPDPELAVAVAASSLPVRLDGRKATVSGTVRGPLEEILFGSTRAASGVAWGEGSVANAVVSPGLLRRERVGPSGSWEETVLVAPALPLVVLGIGPGGNRPTSVELTALPDATDLRYRCGGGAITLAERDSGAMLTIVAHPPSSSWSVDSAPSGGARLRCSNEGGIESIALAYGPDVTIRPALAGARHLTGHARRAGARPDDDILALDTGAYGLDQAVAWMQRRLGSGIDSALHRDSGAGRLPGEEGAWLWAGLGAVAIGDLERARRCASTLHRLGRPDGATFLQARAALSDGRTDGLMEAAERSLATPGVEDPALRRLGLRAAADALRYAATESDVRRLAAAAGPEVAEANPREPVTGGGVRLPTFGGGSASPRGDAPAVTPGAWLSRMLEGPRDGRYTASPDRRESPASVTRAQRAWTEMTSSGDGWSLWRAMVAEGIESGAWGVGSWDPFDPGTPPATAGVLLSAMAFGWLGALPDAPVGRLALRPRVPERVRSFRFTGVAIGDARLDLAYERSGFTHRFDLEPRRGRVPPLVVFETTVPGPSVHVTIDGVPAELDATRTGAGVTVRLQTPLDATRRIEIETGAAAE